MRAKGTWLRVKPPRMRHVVLSAVHHDDVPTMQHSKIRHVVLVAIAAADLDGATTLGADFRKDVSACGVKPGYHVTALAHALSQ